MYYETYEEFRKAVKSFGKLSWGMPVWIGQECWLNAAECLADHEEAQ